MKKDDIQDKLPEIQEEVPVDPHASLNAAAAVLIGMLAQPVREVLLETAVVTLKLPLWQLVAGMVQQNFDMGLFTTPILDPSWTMNMPVVPTTYAVARCEMCGEQFQPRWPHERFCSNLCGTKYQRDELDRRQPKHVVGGKHALGKEPPKSVRSAL